jgi:hypothetical protein
MNQNKKIIIALAVFAILLAIVLVVRQSPYETKTQTNLPTIPTLDIAGIDKVELVNKDDALTFTLKGENWWITQPKEVMANDSFKTLVVDKLGDIALDRLVSDNADTHEKFEVGDNGTRLTAYAKGEAKLTLVVGKNTPDYRGTFIRMPDSDSVFATQKVLGGSLKKDLTYWRDKTIVELERADLTEITFSQGGKSFTLLKKPAEPNPDPNVPSGSPATPETWVFMDSQAEAVDQNRIKTTLSTLTMLNWADIIDEPQDLASYGLDKPTANLTLKGADGVEHKILIGNTTENGESAYVLVEGQTPVYSIRKYQYERMTKDRNFYKGE